MRRLLPWLFASLGALLLIPSWLDLGPGPDSLAPQGVPQVDALRWSGGLLVVGGLLAALPGLLRRASVGRAGAGGRRIEILEVRPLAPRRQLLLVKVEGKTLLLGSSEAGLQSLGTVDAGFDGVLRAARSSSLPAEQPS